MYKIQIKDTFHILFQYWPPAKVQSLLSSLKNNKW